MSDLHECRQAKRQHKSSLLQQTGVVSVGIGFKWVNGKQTNELAVIVGVKQKRPLAELSPHEMIPRTLRVGQTEVSTDVIEVGEVKALSFTQRRRPCPGGYSCGHFRITAGTLGAWLRRISTGELVILSNNHVLADSNEASVGDEILQPGPVDGGTTFVDRLATLTDFARIRFDGEGNGKKENRGARLYWRTVGGLAGGLARLFGCPYRLRVSAYAVEQPWPNLVDAALARVVQATDALLEIEQVGPLVGLRDAPVGVMVQKSGRTTGYNQGTIGAVENTVKVSYGAGKVATFDDQYMIGPAGFSAGGDSGSVICDMEGYAIGLLFAGSNTWTFANRISNVTSLLGVRLP